MALFPKTQMKELKSTPTRCFRFVSLGDLHMGHPKINIFIFIENIRTIVFPHLINIDILFIPGDFFDTLFTMSNKVSIAIAGLMRDLMNLAVLNGFLIRVVRGTYLHDRNQNDFWDVLTPNLGLTDQENQIIKVFNSISVESVLNLNIVYIPDGSPKETISIIKQLMLDRGISKIDVVAGHGQFEHNIPNGAVIHDTIFKAEDFSFVTGPVLFGHIHTFSVYKNIVYSGSLERLRHGEESKKGFPKITYSVPDYKTQFEFVENTESTIFKTINMEYIDSEEIAIAKYNSTVSKLIQNVNKTSYIRVISDNSIIRDSLRVLSKKMFPSVFLTFKKTKENESSVKLTNSNIKSLEFVTEDNIHKNIHSFLNGKLSLEEISEIIDNL